MSKRYFFDTSAFLAIVKYEPAGERVLELSASLRDRQKVTSVLVAYELYRGISPRNAKHVTQRRILDALLAGFTIKSLTNAQAMAAARLYQYSKGFADSLIGAQCIEGGFDLVTTNVQDFERMPEIRIHTI